jgi:gas vesicle protein
MAYQENDGGRGFLAFSLGMIAGAVTALLLAPATGSETRRKLGEATQGIRDKAKEGLERAGDFVNQQKDRFTGAVEEGKQTFARETQGAGSSGSSSSYGSSTGGSSSGSRRSGSGSSGQM